MTNPNDIGRNTLHRHKYIATGAHAVSWYRSLDPKKTMVKETTRVIYTCSVCSKNKEKEFPGNFELKHFQIKESK